MVSIRTLINQPRNTESPSASSTRPTASSTTSSPPPSQSTGMRTASDSTHLFHVKLVPGDSVSPRFSRNSHQSMLQIYSCSSGSNVLLGTLQLTHTHKLANKDFFKPNGTLWEKGHTDALECSVDLVNLKKIIAKSFKEAKTITFVEPGTPGKEADKFSQSLLKSIVLSQYEMRKRTPLEIVKGRVELAKSSKNALKTITTYGEIVEQATHGARQAISKHTPMLKESMEPSQIISTINAIAKSLAGIYCALVGFCVSKVFDTFDAYHDGNTQNVIKNLFVVLITTGGLLLAIAEVCVLRARCTALRDAARAIKDEFNDQKVTQTISDLFNGFSRDVAKAIADPS